MNVWELFIYEQFQNLNINSLKFTFFLVPSQAPADVQLFNTSSTSLKAVWGPVPVCCRHGIIRGYRLFLRDNISRAFVRNETVAAGVYEFEFLSSLLKFYGYSISVLAFTIKGDGPLSEDVSAMTEEDGKVAKTQDKASWFLVLTFSRNTSNTRGACFMRTSSRVKTDAWPSFMDELAISEFPLPLLQNEPKYETFHVKISLTQKFIQMQIQQIFIHALKVCTRSRFETEAEFRTTLKWPTGGELLLNHTRIIRNNCHIWV